MKALMGVSGNGSLKIGECLIEQDLDRISRGSLAVTVRPQVMDVLIYLASKGGQIVHADELLENLWPNKVVTSASIYTCITELRRAFLDCDSGQPYIDTVSKRGYRLVVPVRSLNEPTAAASQIAAFPSSWQKVFIVMALLATGVILFAWDTWRPLTPTDKSIAVMAFENLSDDPEQEYFSDGISEELLNTVAQIPELRVISRSSAFSFKGKGVSVTTVAKQLNVAHVLEGSVRREGNRVRITAQLIEASSNTQVWSESYDRELADVFVLQGEIANAIADEIRITLTPAVAARIDRVRSVDPEAYALWLKGNYHLMGLDDESFRKAIASYQGAIDRDAEYAPAYAGLAMAVMELGGWFTANPRDDFVPKSRKAAIRAIELDPDLAEGHMALGQIRYLFDWDWPGADRAFKRGIALTPSTMKGRLDYANFLNAMGSYEESIKIGRQSLELDPVSILAHVELFFSLYSAGRFDEALEIMRQLQELDSSAEPHLFLSFFYSKRGEFDKALEHLTLYLDAQPATTPSFIGHIGLVYGLAGRHAEARDLLSRLMDLTAHNLYTPPTAVANIYIGLGEYEEALRWLELAYEEHHVSLVWLKEGWIYDPLRSDPRFQSILDRMAFPKP